MTRPLDLSDEDRALIRHVGRVWSSRRRVGHHSLRTHALTPMVKRMLRFIAHDCGMRVAFRSAVSGDGVIYYLIAKRKRWHGRPPPSPERKATPD